VYLLANWAYLRLLGESGVAASESLAADAVGGAVGKRLIAGAVAVSAFGILNAQLLAGPRLVYGMAVDGRFFAVFGRLGRFGTPAAAIALMGAIALLLLWAAGPKGVDKLLNGVMTVDGFFIGLTAVAVMVLRERNPAVAFRAPLYPLTPIVFALGCFGVVAGTFLNPEMRFAAIIGAAWILSAAVLYLILHLMRVYWPEMSVTVLGPAPPSEPAPPRT
jgi:APA family basic amino acid/polyamine antiporter